MGLISDLVGATVKTALTPIAIIKDGVNLATGNDPECTKNLFESITEDLDSAGDNIGEGEL